MTIRLVVGSRQGKIASIAGLLLGAHVLLISVPMAQSQDGQDKGSYMLDNLKRRSPEERWQRVKKLYPDDTSASRSDTPARLPDDAQRGQTNDAVPPAPEPTQLIPRLTALPADTSNDWLVTVREPLPDDGEAVAQSAATQPATPAPVPNPADNVNPPQGQPAVAVPAPAVGSQEAEMKKGPTGDVVVGLAGSRPLGERLINAIDPYYDRDRDADIREFAVEKGKEFGVTFKPKAYPQREFPEVVLAWEATNFFYHPLYFSDPALERYGHVHHPLIQPFASIGRFGTQLVFLPYQMTIDPICAKTYPLGYYRPGDCAPKLHYQVPLNAEAAVVQAAALTGLYFLIVQ